jgi:hypothetical protein
MALVVTDHAELIAEADFSFPASGASRVYELVLSDMRISQNTSQKARVIDIRVGHGEGLRVTNRRPICTRHVLMFSTRNWAVVTKGPQLADELTPFAGTKARHSPGMPSALDSFGKSIQIYPVNNWGTLATDLYVDVQPVIKGGIEIIPCGSFRVTDSP